MFVFSSTKITGKRHHGILGTLLSLSLFWGLVFIVSKAEFPVILVRLPCQWWFTIPSFCPYPSVRSLLKHKEEWIWVLWLLFSCRKGEGCCCCFSYAFVSTSSQSCIYNPRGNIGFRHNSRLLQESAVKLISWPSCAFLFFPSFFF